MGDMHQPMHVGRLSDDYGRKTLTTLGGEATNMFNVWESGLIRQETRGSAWWSGWTQIGNAPSFNKDQQDFKDKGIDVIDDWINENAKFTCEHVIPQYTPAIDNTVNTMWRQDLRARLLVAGSRTAVVSHAILAERSKRERNSFRGGSAFAPLPEPDLTEMAVTTQSGAALVNLGVLATVLLVFVLFARHINHTSHLKD
jgi:hypothetical protein